LFNTRSYSKTDRAYYTWSIDDNLWAYTLSGYGFSTKMIDVYGNIKDTTPVVSKTGTGAYDFKSTDYEGVYYVFLEMTSPAGSVSDVAYDYSVLTGYVRINGVVYDGYTGLAINVSNVSIVQGATVSNSVTSYGNYTTGSTSFAVGSTMLINATATGYRQYLHSFTPPTARTLTIDIILEPLFIPSSGYSIAGVNRDNPYGRPIPYDIVTISNATYGESYNVTGNLRAFYQLDQADGAYLTYGRWYSVVAHTSGYSNSPAYLVQVV
jgi:hypothetical protein